MTTPKYLLIYVIIVFALFFCVATHTSFKIQEGIGFGNRARINFEHAKICTVGGLFAIVLTPSQQLYRLEWLMTRSVK